ncbi:DUF397 domain-containing protein [Streptomyces sp. V2]|uniref:DUF397 domain-containing protein n=1 Tax=Streptomyces TaxID=1883 RepID=UPI0006EBB501|nr:MULTISPECIES: DUF397 domain-containing protein [Streptomyces]PWG10889.1 DUF397 domain-containing protein [Streptomyces sp. V2]
MIRKNLPADGWQKSSYSNGAGADCVEYLPLPAGEVAIRDSKIPARGAFVFPTTSWTSFVDAVKRENLPRT